MEGARGQTQNASDQHWIASDNALLSSTFAEDTGHKECSVVVDEGAQVNISVVPGRKIADPLV